VKKLSGIVLSALIAAMAFTLAWGQAEQAKYAGADNCKMCHSDKHKEWSKTAHARAFDLLVNVEQEKNAECLSCHSTGYGKGGFVDLTSTANLAGVTCEACHGPGAGHMGDKTKIVRTPSAAVCASCHKDQNIH